MRFWMSFWAGADGDLRPLRDDAKTPAWACSGERSGEPRFSVCAVVDVPVSLQSDGKSFRADQLRAYKLAWARIRRHWPEAVERFCNQVADDWLPGDRFPTIAAKLRERGGA